MDSETITREERTRNDGSLLVKKNKDGSDSYFSPWTNAIMDWSSEMSRERTKNVFLSNSSSIELFKRIKTISSKSKFYQKRHILKMIIH